MKAPAPIPIPSVIKPRVTIVVLTWNGLSYTKACLESLHETTDLAQARIVVVDNGSTDGTVDYLTRLDWISPIFNERNLGFVRGNNAALKRLEPAHDVILLNNDAVVTDRQWIEKFQSTAYSAPDVGIVGCRLRRTGTRMLQHTGTYMPDVTYWGQQIGGGEADINQYNQDREVEGVVFACVYIKRAVLDQIGPLDEDYFSYYEDTDYCLKARQAGFKVMNCGALTVLHREHGSTDANEVSHSDMFLRSKETFLEKWRRYLDTRRDLRVNWHSTFSRPIGYAMASRCIAKGLENAGIAVAYRYLYGEGTAFPVHEDSNESSGDYQIEIIKQRHYFPDAPNVIFGQADAFAAVEGACRVGWTMLETTAVPEEWIRQCNLMNEIWVPSAFNTWTFRRSGVEVPILEMPLGLIDEGHFNPAITGSKLEGMFTFLSIFEWGERKAPEILIRAFNRTFRRDEPVVLICKYVNRDPEVDPERTIAELGLDPRGGLILFSRNEEIPYHELAFLYRSADCFVLTTRGEGWGMPILEAMACGLPVIASYWSAQQTYMTDSNSYPLQVSLVDAEAKCPYYAGSKWAEPDEDHLALLLRRTFENQEEAAGRGAKAALDVKERWSISVCSQRVRSRISELESGSRSGEHQTHLRIRTNKPATRRIAIDVSRAIGAEITGIGRYVVALVRGLTRTTRDENPFDYLLLPGFHSFVHPEYLRPFDFEPHLADDRFTVYRGPLPAYGVPETYVPGVAAVHCTANTWSSVVDVPSVMVAYDLTFVTHPEFHTQENIELCRNGFEQAVKSNCLFSAISQNTRKDLIEQYGVDESRVFVAYPGVDQREFHRRSSDEVRAIRGKYRLPERFFLYVGSLEPRKNLRTLIDAMSVADAQESLVVVGASGWRNSELHDAIRRAGEKIVLLGYVSQTDLPALYSAATATVYPSLYEGFGYPVVESMACGTPVITSDNSSLTEIAHDAAALIAEPTNRLEIARVLSEVASNIRVREQLAHEGANRAARFTPEACARATLKCYEQLVR